MHPKVSVIIPAYNVAPYIGKSLQSVLQQAEQSFEIIVVDDCSTDETAAVVHQFRDNRIRLLQNEQNRGQSYSRNRAMQEAKGEWLALLDADDWWSPKRLAVLLEIAEDEKVDMIADDLLRVYTEDEQRGTSVLSTRGARVEKPIQIPMITFIEWDLGIMKPLIRRTFWHTAGIQFDESLRAGEEDFPFFLQCLIQGAKFLLVPEAYYFYRLRPGSMVSRRVHLFQKTKEVTLSLLRKPDVQIDEALVKALQKRICYVDHVIVYNHIKADCAHIALFSAMKRIYQTPTVIPFAFQQISKRFTRSL